MDMKYKFYFFRNLTNLSRDPVPLTTGNTAPNQRSSFPDNIELDLLAVSVPTSTLLASAWPIYIIFNGIVSAPVCRKVSPGFDSQILGPESWGELFGERFYCIQISDRSSVRYSNSWDFLYISLFSPEGSAKLRWVADIYFLGCSIAHLLYSAT